MVCVIEKSPCNDAPRLFYFSVFVKKTPSENGFVLNKKYFGRNKRFFSAFL